MTVADPILSRDGRPLVRTAPSAGSASARALLAAAVSAALCATPQTYAQQAADGLTLEEIVVTATLRRVNIQDVPQSISVLSTEEIEQAGYRDMGDYIRALPSVTLAQSQPGRNDIVFRGVSTGTEQFYGDAQAGVYLDEQPITTNSQQVSPYLVDIDRIEALPGPQGTLFGSSAQTGVLRIITNKPDPSGFSGQYSATGFATKGGAGSYEVDGHLNIPLIDDKLTARIVGFYSDQGGWIDNVYGTDLARGLNNANAVKSNSNDWKVSGVRLAALWTVNDRANVLFNLTTQNDTTKGDWLSDPYLGDAKITRFIEQSRHDNWWQAAITATVDLGFAELKSASAYFQRHITYEFDNMTYEQYKSKHFGSYYAVPGTQQNGVPGYNIYNTRLLSDGSFTTSTVFNDQHQYRFSQEFRLTSKGTSRLQWIGGLFYEHVHDNWFYGTQVLPLTSTYAWPAANVLACDYQSQGYNVQCPLAPTTIGYAEWFDRVFKQTAVFGELSYKLTEPWTVTGGARWFKYDRSVDDTYDFPLGVPTGLGVPGAGSSSGNDNGTLYKLGTQYKYNDNGMVYLLYSQGYRFGGSNSQRAASTGTIAADYSPDKLYNYEAGLKSQWLDRRVTLNASLFLMRWQDIQLESSNVGGQWWLRGTINGGTAETKGIELSGAAKLTRQLSLDFSLIAADPKLTQDIVYPDGTEIPSGTTMSGAPKFKSAAGIEYDFNWRPLGGELWARFDYSYQSSEYQSLNAAAAGGADGRISAWSYGKFQLGVNLPNKLDVTLTLDNIWNSNGSNWIDTSEGGNADQFGDPRYHNMQAQFRPQNIGLTIRKKF